MSEKLTAKIFDFFITTKCTMSCKLCAAAIPYIEHPKHTPKEIAFREMQEFFKIWDYAERVELIGGEPLMHPDICEIAKETLKYKDQFGGIRVTTNATIVPSDDLLEFAASCDKYFDFVVDDYGELSKNLIPLTTKLDKYGVPYRVDVYHGENQRFGGWVYFGDYNKQDHSKEKLQSIFKNCIAPKNSFYCVNDGKVFSCCYALSLYLVKGLLPHDGGYIDLFDNSIGVDEKRKIAKGFCKVPIGACHYCHGFDNENGQRYLGPPEQLLKKRGHVYEYYRQ